MPPTEGLSSGNERVIFAWDILPGKAKPGEPLLIERAVYDEAAAHGAAMMNAADRTRCHAE